MVVRLADKRFQVMHFTIEKTKTKLGWMSIKIEKISIVHFRRQLKCVSVGPTKWNTFSVLISCRI